jgi:hypothetical protein
MLIEEVFEKNILMMIDDHAYVLGEKAVIDEEGALRAELVKKNCEEDEDEELEEESAEKRKKRLNRPRRAIFISQEEIVAKKESF